MKAGPSGLRCAASSIAMFAIKGDSPIYHVVSKGAHITLCGLRFTTVPSGLVLHAIKVEPPDRTLCQHCERIRDAEDNRLAEFDP